MLAALTASWTLGRGLCLQRAPPGLGFPRRCSLINVLQFRRAHTFDDFFQTSTTDESETQNVTQKKKKRRRRTKKPSRRDQTVRKLAAAKLKPPTRIPPPRTPSVGACPTLISQLFRAMQKGRSSDVCKILVELAWRPESRATLVKLAPLTFAEVLDFVDPLRIHAEADVLDGARISPSMMLLSDVPTLVDVNAVRWVYRDLLETMYPVVGMRVEEKMVVPSSVFLVLLRLAGACAGSLYTGTIVELAREAAHLGLTDPGILSSPTFYCDYVKTKFLTEPLYYQYDKTNVRLRPRFCPAHYFGVTRRKERKLDALRLHLRVNQVPLSGEFKGAPGSNTWQLHNRIGQRHLVPRILSFKRLEKAGLTEELFCTVLVASTRSGTSHLLRRMFARYHDIVIHYGRKGCNKITGGAKKRGKGVFMTEKTFYAISSALGSIGDFDLALRLIAYLSRLHRIPVPSGVWADWLSWAYVHGAKPAVDEWRIVGDARRLQPPRQIVALVNMLKDQGYQFNVGFDELIIVAKRLIAHRDIAEALDALRTAHGMILDLVEEHEMAALRVTASLIAGIQFGRTMSNVRLAKKRDVAVMEMHVACQAWLDMAGSIGRRQLKEGPGGRRVHDPAARLTTVTVPDFVAEFHDLLPPRIKYDAPTGTVEMDINRMGLTTEVHEVTSPQARLDIQVPKIRTRPVRNPLSEVGEEDDPGVENAHPQEDIDGQFEEQGAYPQMEIDNQGAEYAGEETGWEDSSARRSEPVALDNAMFDWRGDVGKQLREQSGVWDGWAPEGEGEAAVPPPPVEYEEYVGYDYDRIVFVQEGLKYVSVRPPDPRISRFNRAVVYRDGNRLLVLGTHESVLRQITELEGTAVWPASSAEEWEPYLRS